MEVENRVKASAKSMLTILGMQLSGMIHLLHQVDSNPKGGRHGIHEFEMLVIRMALP